MQGWGLRRCCRWWRKRWSDRSQMLQCSRGHALVRIPWAERWSKQKYMRLPVSTLAPARTTFQASSLYQKPRPLSPPVAAQGSSLVRPRKSSHVFEPAGSCQRMSTSLAFFKLTLRFLHDFLSSLPKTPPLPWTTTASRCVSRTRRTLSPGISSRISS